MDIIHRIARQPAKLLSAVQAIFALGLIAGWWSFETMQDADRTIGALILAVSAILAVISEYVTPVADPILQPGTVVNANTDKFATSRVEPLEEDVT